MKFNSLTGSNLKILFWCSNQTFFEHSQHSQSYSYFKVVTAIICYTFIENS